jgi:hypothetical protein
MRYNWFFAVGAISLVGWTCCSRVQAQFEAPPNSLAFEDTGTLEAVEDGLIQIRDSKTEAWLLQIVGETKVTVDGEAEPDYLRPGLPVRFNAKIDKKGVLQKPLAEIEIFTPQSKSWMGLFPEGEDDPDAKPDRTGGAGTFQIKGKLISFRDNELVVSAGSRKISGQVADEFTVKVKLDDPSIAQNGDTVKVKFWYYDNSKPIPAANRLGKGRAEEITITLAKKLAPSVKKLRQPEKSARPAAKSAKAARN